ncbi:MAG: TatD family hydrolase [Bacillota bacterium]
MAKIDKEILYRNSNKNTIDVHCHLTDDRYALENIKAGHENVAVLILSGTSEQDSANALEIANEMENAYACVGIHPHEVCELSTEYVSVIRDLATNKKVVAIGECGLDYHFEPFDKALQQKVFRDMIALAISLDLPLVVHQRDSDQDTFDILKEYKGKLKFMLHCYSGSVEMAKEYLKIGAYFSFSGTLTFKNNKKAVETVEILPLDRIFSETDSPYLAPEGYRGKTNYPKYSYKVIEKIADIKNIGYDEVFGKIRENVKDLFGV